MNPVVSICCLAYNHEEYIKKCLDGFIMQKTNFAFEVLIHDDASTDNTAKIIEDYTKKYPLIFKPIYQTENQFSKGVRVNKDFNFLRAIGKYIALCEGDDYWTDPLKLQKQIDFLEVNQDYSYCGHQSLILDNDELNENQVKIGVLTLEDIISKNSIHTATLMFRKAAIIKLPDVFNNVIAGDWILQIIALQYGNAYVLKDVMSVYRKHENGIWSQLDKSKMGQQGVDTLIAAKELFNDNEKILTLINQAIYKRQKEFGLIKDSILKRIIKRLKFLIKKT